LKNRKVSKRKVLLEEEAMRQRRGRRKEEEWLLLLQLKKKIAKSVADASREFFKPELNSSLKLREKLFGRS